MALDVAQVYADMAPKLRSYFVGRLPPHDRDSADDLAADTFVRVLAALPRYQDRGKLAAWVWQIAHNLLRDRLRHLMRVAPVPLDPLRHDRADPHPAGYEHVLARLTLDAILAASPITDEQRVALDAFYLRDESDAMTEARTGLSPEILKKRRLRALAAMRKVA